MAKFINFDESGNIVGRYLSEIHSNIPDGATAVTDKQWVDTLDNSKGDWKLVDGTVTLVPYPIAVIVPPTCAELCLRIDQAADAARMAVVVDPVRAIEYDRARVAAEQFRDAGYPDGDVPPMVLAWAIGGRSATDAANNILAEAAAYTGALEFLRTFRLKSKQDLKDLFAENDVDGAVLKADEAVAEIEAAVEGIGNARA